MRIKRDVIKAALGLTGDQGNVLQPFPTQFQLFEQFQRRPALKADRDTFTASVAAAEAVKLSIANPHFGLLGTNAVDADCTFAAGGGITLSTHGASGDSTILLPHLSTNQSAWAAVTWKTDDMIVFDTQIKTGANITATTIYAGFKLTNTNVVATDNDQVFFRYQDTVNGGTWGLVASRSDVDVTTDSLMAVAVSTAYRLTITLDANRVPRFYINGALIFTGTALTAAISLIPYIGIVAAAAAVKSVTVRGLICAKQYND